MAIGRLPISAYCLVKRVTAKTQYGLCREDDRERAMGSGRRRGKSERERQKDAHRQRERQRGNGLVVIYALKL